MADYTEIALKLHEQNIVAIPVDDQKKALTEWSKLSYKTNGQAKITARFGGDPYGVAILTGSASNNLEAIDIELKADGTDLYPTICKLIHASPRLRNVPFLSVKTPRGGYHLIYRCADVTPPQRLATIGSQVVISTKGEKGYIVTLPTPGYLLMKGGAIPVITPVQRAMLFSVLRCFDKPDFSDMRKRII